MVHQQQQACCLRRGDAQLSSYAVEDADCDVDAFQFWKTACSHYKDLAMVAVKYLGVPLDQRA